MVEKSPVKAASWLLIGVLCLLSLLIFAPQVTATLGAPTLSSPSNGSSTTDTTPYFDWDYVSGAYYYQIQVDDYSSFYTPVIDTYSFYSYYDTVTSLSPGTYYWRVRAYDYYGVAGSWSSTWSFTTILPAPTLSSPSNYATGVSITPTFSWSSVSGADYYQIQVSTSSSFSTTVIDETYLSSTSYTPYSSEALSYSTSYYWRIRGYSYSYGYGNWSSTWSFTTGKAPTSLSISPPNFTVHYGETQTLTATLTSGGTSLEGKTISWVATSGSVYPWSSTTDYWGEASTTYTAPSYETSVTITASFAGDSQYDVAIATSSATVRFTVVFTFTKPDGRPLAYTTIYYGTSEGRETSYLGTTDYSGKITSTDSALAGYTLYFKSSDGAYHGSTHVSYNGGAESVPLESTGYELWMIILALLVVLGVVGGAAYWFKHKPRVTGAPRAPRAPRPPRLPKAPLKPKAGVGPPPHDDTIAYVPVMCPHCKHPNLPTAKFCSRCGRKLGGEK
jgi:hypothetical protein